ncbi:hypothetical protein J2S14_003961 [Lederbergia wuyishanensis]|uniref:Uncharacterized protein n=1 Tax=Lederbergia wuyishanensis TaxID=1347903 RepID=A0ABU0D9L5_9BACI|nr:hypothetical protein [Lederbergia wuyishanensis]
MRLLLDTELHIIRFHREIVHWSIHDEIFFYKGFVVNKVRIPDELKF